MLLQKGYQLFSHSFAVSCCFFFCSHQIFSHSLHCSNIAVLAKEILLQKGMMAVLVFFASHPFLVLFVYVRHQLYFCSLHGFIVAVREASTKEMCCFRKGISCLLCSLPSIHYISSLLLNLDGFNYLLVYFNVITTD